MNNRAQLAASITVVALIFCVLFFGLLPAVFVGTLLFICIRILEQVLPEKLPYKRITGLAITLVLFIFLVVVICLASSKLMGPNGVAGLLLKVSSILDQLRGSAPESWRDYIPEGIDQLKEVLADQFKMNAKSLTQISVNGLHQGAHLILSVIVAAMLGASTPSVPTGAFTAPLHQHIVNFADSMVKVFSAQFKVASISATFTGIFLLIFLPIMGVHIPFAYIATMLTFILGMIPVVGNLLSNTLNVLLGLSVAPWVALICLVFLVLSHKMEYLLCARYVGAGVGAKTWELLTAMILLESIFGPIGFAAAPVLYAWMKTELRIRQLL